MSPGRSPDLVLALELADAADAITLSRFRATDLRIETKPDYYYKAVPVLSARSR